MTGAPRGGEGITVGSIVLTAGLLAALAVPSGAFGDKPADPGSGEDAEGTPQGVVVTVEETADGTSTAEVTSTEAAVPEEATEDEATEDAAVESGVADSSVETSSATQTQEATYSQAAVTTETVVRRSRGKKAKSAKKSKKSRKCAAPLAQAAAPPASGCTRLNTNNGNLVLPDGTTLTITETSQGIINFTVSGGPTGTFTGTIFVKGGPSSPGFACVFNNVTSGTCNTPSQPNGNLYGVSHVDACPGTFVPPGTPGNPPGSQGERDNGRAGGQKKEKKTGAERSDPAAVAAAETAVAAEAGLPVTGLPLIWLILIGGGLIGGGVGVGRAGSKFD